MALSELLIESKEEINELQDQLQRLSSLDEEIDNAQTKEYTEDESQLTQLVAKMLHTDFSSTKFDQEVDNSVFDVCSIFGWENERLIKISVGNKTFTRVDKGSADEKVCGYFNGTTCALRFLQKCKGDNNNYDILFVTGVLQPDMVTGEIAENVPADNLYINYYPRIIKWSRTL
jgi:hypothetical protein